MKPILLMLSMFAVACGGSMMGDDDDGGIQPRLIGGGGVSDAPIAGALYVHVVEANASTPISGATVHVGAQSGTTDATGLATFSGVTGPQTIAVTAIGHAGTTWVGVGGTNATLPMDASPRNVPTAHATGTIAGWNSLPAPPLGKYTLGLVLYSFLDDPTAPENSIAQTMSGGAPLNTCIRSALSNTCTWQLNTRIGTQIHTAVIVEGDPHGTNDDVSDDTYVLKGYAAGETLTLSANQQVNNESLTMVTATTPFSVSWPVPVAGLPATVAIPELSLVDGSGRIVFPLPTLSATDLATQVIAATGRFSGKFEVVSLATPTMAATTPFSTSFVHDVTATGAVPPWLPPPAAVTGGPTFTFTPVPGAAFYTAQVLLGTLVMWNVTVLDSSTSFAIDGLAPGSMTFAVTAADAPGFDPTMFEIPKVKSSLVRASGAQAGFTKPLGP